MIVAFPVASTGLARPSGMSAAAPGGGMADSDWSGLMAAAQSGDGSGYHRLLREVGTWLQRYYARRLPPAMVDDTVQDTLLAIHEKRHTYDPARPFGPWLAAIARYKWIDRLRAMKTAPTEALSEEIPVGDHGDAVTSAHSLDRLLMELKPAQSTVIRMVKLQGFSIEEAAARTGQSPSLVKVNIHRGLGRLAALVRERPMPDNQFFDRLVADLKPVRRRSVSVDALVLAALCGVELAIFLLIGPTRPGMPAAMGMMSFWWKLASLGLIAIVGAVTTLLSFDPVASPRRGLRWLVTLVAVALAVGWGLDAARDGVANLLMRLAWQDGVQCVWKMVALSLPAVIGLGLLMRRGAPTDTGGTALAVGVTASAWGAFVFVFACPYDDPFYIAVWYTLGCGLVTLAARLLLPVLTRW